MRYFLLIFCITHLLPSQTFAQYKGGLDDGNAASISTVTQNQIPDIFRGGLNDGTAMQNSTNQNQLPGIFKGGLNDGSAFSVSLAQNALPDIFHGGQNDGFAFAATNNQNQLPSIFKGGLDDGSAIATSIGQNSLPSIFRGGVNDGAAISVLSNQNALPSIYTGGANDGYAFVVSLNQNSNNPLNLILLSFTGSWANEDALLTWKTIDDTHVDYFELERSVDGGKNFAAIGQTVPFRKVGENTYIHTDAGAWNLKENVLLYRLKSFNMDGDFYYSGIVKLKKDKNAPVFSLFPNPTTDRVTLELLNSTEAEGYNYVLMDIGGRVINKEKITGVKTIFEFNAMPAASYQLIIFDKGVPIQNFKIQVLH